VNRPLPHYPSQRDRDDAAAAAGWIVIALIALDQILAIYAVLHLVGLLP